MPAAPRIAVVGGGIYGWSIALRLAERGAAVTVVDPRPVDDGDRASGGTTRVLRLEYGDAAVYSELTVRALDAWREIERRTRTELYVQTGVLFLVPDGDTGSWESSSLEVTRQLGYPGDVLQAGEVARRWPGIRPDGIQWALANRVGGILRANRATAAVASLAQAAGAEFIQQPASEVEAGGLTLAEGTRMSADVVVLATGSWTRRLVPTAAIRPTRQVITYLRGGPPDIPVFSDGAPFAIYGMPAFGGEGMKIASHAPGDEVDPDDPAERSARHGEVDHVADYARRRFAIAPAEARVARTEICFYAMTPTEDPVVDRLPDGRILCAGFSGHGFKYAPVLGRAVADLALGDDPELDLSRFAWSAGS